MKHKRGVNNMNGIKFENNDYPCLRCMYLTQVIKVNEDSEGNSDLRVYCSIAGCPEGVIQKGIILKTPQQTEAYRKISNCIEMLKRCIELKSKGCWY
jgi:hypothetical protein